MMEIVFVSNDSWSQNMLAFQIKSAPNNDIRLTIVAQLN